MRIRPVLTLVLVTLGACAHVIPLPSPPPDLWLEPVRVSGGPVFFADEVEPVSDALAEILARPEYGAYHVVPMPRLRALWANAQRGVLPGVHFVCGAPPPPALLAAAVFPHLARAETEIQCDARGCDLSLDIKQDGVPAASRRKNTHWTASLKPGGSPAEWAASLRAHGLEPVTPTEILGGVLGVLSGGESPGLHVMVRDVEVSGPWSKPLSAERLKPIHRALFQCRTPARLWQDWWEQPFVVEVAPDGHIDRCEYQYPDHLPPPEFACQCDVLRRFDFGHADGVRRAAFALDLADIKPAGTGARITGVAHLQPQSATDPTAILGTGFASDDSLGACLNSLQKQVPELSIPVVFQVGADGHALSHHVAWPGALPSEANRCLDQVLSGVQFNCPLSGSATVSASLSIEGAAEGGGQGALGDVLK